MIGGYLTSLQGVIAGGRQRGDVILYLSGDGTNGSTSIVDESVYANALTLESVQVSTAQAKFGDSALLFGSTATPRIDVVDSALWDLGSDDWTIECWAYLSAAPSSHYLFEMIWNGGATGTYIRVTASPTRQIQFFHNGGGSSSATMPLTQWVHFAVMRSSGTVRFTLDGVQIASISASLPVNLSDAFRVGNSRSTGLAPWNGYIEQFRVTKGVARYTVPFTPPSGPFK